MPATATLTVDDLLALWHGDEDSDGYWQPELVARVCELIQPGNVLVVRNRFYPSKAGADVPEDAAKMIVSGYWTWRRRSR